MRLPNSEVAQALDMNHSSVSRMRAGRRVASVETLQRIVKEYNADPAELMAAATKASHGETDEWVQLLNRLFDDGEPDPDESVKSEPELVN